MISRCALPRYTKRNKVYSVFRKMSALALVFLISILSISRLNTREFTRAFCRCARLFLIQPRGVLYFYYTTRSIAGKPFRPSLTATYVTVRMAKAPKPPPPPLKCHRNDGNFDLFAINPDDIPCNRCTAFNQWSEVARYL